MFVQHASLLLEEHLQVSVTCTMMDREGLNNPCSVTLHMVTMQQCYPCFDQNAVLGRQCSQYSAESKPVMKRLVYRPADPHDMHVQHRGNMGCVMYMSSTCQVHVQ